MGAGEPVADLGFYSVPETDIPLITAVQGGAWGLGFYMVCASDICVAAEGARFAMSEIPTGIIGPALFPILNNLPWLPGSEIVIRGHQFDAQRAYELGLANHVVPADQLESTAMEPRRGDRGPAAGARACHQAAVDDGAPAAKHLPERDRLPAGDGRPPPAGRHDGGPRRPSPRSGRPSSRAASAVPHSRPALRCRPQAHKKTGHLMVAGFLVSQCSAARSPARLRRGAVM